MLKKILFVILFFSLAHSADAAGLLDSKIHTEQYAQTEILRENAGLGSNNVETVVAGIIKVFLGLLGIIFVILIILAGFNWMTAGGDEAKIEKAKKLMSRAIIGLIIIVAAYAITKFVFTNLPGGSG